MSPAGPPRRSKGAILTVMLAAAALGAACTSSPIPTCAGEPVLGTTFHASLRSGEGGCHFNSSQQTATDNGLKTAFDFSAIVSQLGDGTALLCLQRTEATPLRGTFVGNFLNVQGVTLPAFVPTQACSCALQVLEALNGTFTNHEDGSLSFAGDLTNIYSAREGVDPATCEPAPTSGTSGGTCGIPCQLNWTVTAVK